MDNKEYVTTPSHLGEGRERGLTLTPPSSWDELTKEQIIYIYSIDRNSMPDEMFKMKVFLYLCGLELCEESYYIDPLRPNGHIPLYGEDGHPDNSNINATRSHLPIEGEMVEDQRGSLVAQLDWIESCMNGTADLMVVLKQTEDSGSTDSTPLHLGRGRDRGLFCVPFEHLYSAIQEYTKFTSNPYDLTDSKIETIDIESQEIDSEGNAHKCVHTYQCPTDMITNITYEQYQNAQQSLFVYWNLCKQMKALIEKIDPLRPNGHLPLYGEDSHPDNNKNTTRSPLPIEGETSEGQRGSIEDLASNIKDAQADFLCHVLTLDHPTIEEKTVINCGEQSIIKKVKHEYKYDSSEAMELAPELKSAPPYLFPILEAQFQGSLLQYKKTFSDLFGGGGGSNEDQFKSMLNTVNTLKKEYGYNGQQEVFDTNAVFIFAALNTMAHNAKEMERISREAKAKSHR